MWPAATFHSRERRHDARIVSRTRAGPMGSPVRKHSLASASRVSVTSGRTIVPLDMPPLPAITAVAGSGGHRRPQPGARHCERHEHDPDDAGPGMRSSGSPGSWPPSAAEVRCLLWTLRPHLKTSNIFPEFGSLLVMDNWTFLTNHARVLLCIAHDPGVRLRDIAVSLDITERRAYGIVTDLAKAGYVLKQKDGRRNRYQ